MTTNSEWMERKLEEQRRLYEKYGKPLEDEHKGEFVAISLEGERLIGKREGEVLKRAVDTFGRGNFALAKVGGDTLQQWFNESEEALEKSNRLFSKDQKWIDDQLAKERRLYDLHAKHLEPEHNGKFVAISYEGEVIADKREGEVLKRAVDTFGRGNFTMARVGHDVNARVGYIVVTSNDFPYLSIRVAVRDWETRCPA